MKKTGKKIKRGIVAWLLALSFTFAFKKEYSTSTYHMADTATSLINGDHLELYLSGHEMTEFERVKQALGAYCRKMSVSLIYVIKVDTSDYGRFVSVFNLVNNAVDNSEYTAWELGHKRDTTNEEYRKKYETIYKKEAQTLHSGWVSAENNYYD